MSSGPWAVHSGGHKRVVCGGRDGMGVAVWQGNATATHVFSKMFCDAVFVSGQKGNSVVPATKGEEARACQCCSQGYRCTCPMPHTHTLRSAFANDKQAQGAQVATSSCFTTAHSWPRRPGPFVISFTRRTWGACFSFARPRAGVRPLSAWGGKVRSSLLLLFQQGAGGNVIIVTNVPTSIWWQS